MKMERTANRRGVWPVFLVGLLIVASGASLPGSAEQRDPKAVEIANAVMKAGGGEGGWASARFLRFTFTYEKDGSILTSRTHYWDRMGDRHRIEMIDREGKNVVCLTDLGKKEGVCTVDGKPLYEAEAKPYIDRAYAVWINDTYWLIMPYKMLDPGVHLKYEGEVKEGGK